MHKQCWKLINFGNPRSSLQLLKITTTMSIPTVPVGTLNCPPIYAHYLPLAQRRILFMFLLQNPIATLMIERHGGFTNSTMIKLCLFFCSYYTIHLTYNHLCPTNIPPIYMETMPIAEAHASILDLLHEEGFSYIVNDLPMMTVPPILSSLLQVMSKVDWCLYFNNVAVSNPPLRSSAPSSTISIPPPPSDRENTSTTIVDPGTPLVRAALVDSTSLLSSYQSVPAHLSLL